MRLLTIILLAILASCATDVPTSKLTKQTPPFLKRYKNKSRELLYIVVKDDVDIDIETRLLIRENIDRFNPEILITKISPDRKIDFDQELRRCEVNENCGLAAWSCSFAKPKGIPCTGGDPYKSDLVREAVRRKKFTQDEILFFFVYNSLLDFSGDPDVLNKLPQIITEAKDELNLVSRMNKESFLYHYREKFGRGPVILSQKYVSPVAKGNYLQKLAAGLHDTYQDLIITKIQKEQIAHERVIVIYPFPQYRYHLKPLEKFFSTDLP